MGPVLTAPNYGDVDGPIIFLAGPIQGAPDWQAEAIRTIGRLDPTLAVASPRTPPPWHGDFEGQIRWEHHYLDRAARDGVILFWLAREVDHACDRAYAQTTRFELGWQMMRHLRDGVPVVVGIEPGFSNERYLRPALTWLAPGIPLFTDLESTCVEAVQLTRRPLSTVAR